MDPAGLAGDTAAIVRKSSKLPYAKLAHGLCNATSRLGQAGAICGEEAVMEGTQCAVVEAKERCEREGYSKCEQIAVESSERISVLYPGYNYCEVHVTFRGR